MAEPARVFVTGALGFIGRALAERLRGQGAEVRGVDLRADHGLDEAEGQVLTLSDGAAVSTSEFFGHYGRLLGKRVPVLPTGPARLLAEGVARVARITGKPTEVNAASAAYLARTGTYSIEKARKLIAYEPKVDLADGMGLTTRWLRREGLV